MFFLNAIFPVCVSEGLVILGGSKSREVVKSVVLFFGGGKGRGGLGFEDEGVSALTSDYIVLNLRVHKNY